MKVTKNRFPEIARILPVTTTSLINKHGQLAVGVAYGRSRKKTGRMALGWKFIMTRVQSGALINDVHYTVHHEYGTRFFPAQPMMRPAMKTLWVGLLGDMKDLERFIR